MEARLISSRAPNGSALSRSGGAKGRGRGGGADVAGGAAPGEGGGVRGDEADVAVALGRGGRRAVYLRLAAGGPQQAADAAEERGLTAAAGADHRHARG